MLFNSYVYIFLFLPIVFGGYFLLNRKNKDWGKIWLILSSIFFYGYWNVLYVPLLLASIGINFAIGKQLQKGLKQKTWLLLGCGLNLGLLAYFKYVDFFIGTINSGLGSDIGLLHIVLPLAISFFTFQQISYLVDSYQGKVRDTDMLNYTLFVSFFPQLIAGPIVHHAEMMPQFSRDDQKQINWDNVSRGIFVFFIGLAKKLIVADTFAQWANAGFDTAAQLNLTEAWFTSLSYSLQLYFDFSGYTDMAIGAALLFNIKLPFNFNSPYKALDIQDFWRRWHMTLSRFLRDYLYIPLGGNQHGKLATYRNLLLTFLLGGLWHGAAWTFVLWGLMHGLGTAVHRLWKGMGLRMPKLIAWFITFNFVNIAFVFFRAEHWSDAIKVLKGMAGLTGITLPYALKGILGSLDQYGVEFGHFLYRIDGSMLTIVWTGLFMLLAVFLPNTNEMAERFKPTLWNAIALILIALAGILFLNRVNEFLYFQF